MEIKGKCVKVMDVQSGMGKKGPWEKLEFLIEYGDQYPKQVCLTLFNKTDHAPAVGDQLTCQVSPESREYNGKYYTNMNCWKIEGFTGNLKRRDTTESGFSGPAAPPTPKSQAQVNSNEDLPF